MIVRIVLVLAFALVNLTTSSIAQTTEPLVAARLQEGLDSLRVVYGARGLVVGIGYPVKGAFLHASGETRPGVPQSVDNVFGIASNTKAFIAVSLLKMQEMRLIDLDDSLGQWLDPIANVNPSIRVRQLLNHSSGLAEYLDFPGLADTLIRNITRQFTQQDVVRWIGPPLFAPGTDTNYTNTGYFLAGMVAERACQCKIQDFVRDSIRRPLKLDSTYFAGFENEVGAVAPPIQDGQDYSLFPRTALNSIAWTAGGMFSTASDMVRWYSALFGGRVLNSESMSELTAIPIGSVHGLGVNRVFSNGFLCFGHQGESIGYRSTMLYDNVNRIVVSVLVNQNPMNVTSLAVDMHRIALEARRLSSTDEESTTITLFPNPSQSTIYLTGLRKDAHIYTAMGEHLGTIFAGEQADFDVSSFDVSGFDAGMYYARSGTKVLPFVVTK